nr:MAG TPA: hypothetical protein [Caudoviricetes sp.]
MTRAPTRVRRVGALRRLWGAVSRRTGGPAAPRVGGPRRGR